VSRTSLPTVALLLAAGCASDRPPPAEALARRQRTAAETARRYDDPRTAAALHARAAASAAAGDRPLLSADASCRQGLALLSAGDAVAAQAPLERAAALARQEGDAALASRALLGLARARRSAGQGDVAGPLAEAASLAERAGDRVAQALAEVGLGALAEPAEAARRYAAAERLAGDAPEVAGPLWLNRARLAEREGDAAAARAAYRAALAPLALADDRVGLLHALRAAARLAEADPAGAAEAASLQRRAAGVAAGLERGAR
jgi:phage FluMu protein gp41